jgi:hypothetical protein
VDRETLQKHLAQAENRVASGERMIARQKGEVAALVREGHDTFVAMTLLMELEAALAIQSEDRDRLRAELQKG